MEVSEYWRVSWMWKWMGGCRWESGGEESAYEVVAEACRERERAEGHPGRRGSKRLVPSADAWSARSRLVCCTVTH